MVVGGEDCSNSGSSNQWCVLVLAKSTDVLRSHVFPPMEG